MELTKMLELVRLTEDELIGGFISLRRDIITSFSIERIRTGNANRSGFQQGFLQSKKIKQKPKANVYRPESNIRLT